MLLSIAQGLLLHGPDLGRLVGYTLAALANQSLLNTIINSIYVKGFSFAQGQPLHGPDSGQPVGYPPAALANPALLNSLSDQGLALLHLAAGLGYDWACNTLITNGADVQLAVSPLACVSSGMHLHSKRQICCVACVCS